MFIVRFEIVVFNVLLSLLGSLQGQIGISSPDLKHQTPLFFFRGPKDNAFLVLTQEIHCVQERYKPFAIAS